jgi:hypothetical protein
MFKVKGLGQVIAERKLVFVSDEGISEPVTLRVGLPYACEEPEAYVCPYELASKNYSKLFGMVGIDTIQALELSVSILKVELDHWEKKFKGKFHFLDEIGHGVK